MSLIAALGLPPLKSVLNATPVAQAPAADAADAKAAEALLLAAMSEVARSLKEAGAQATTGDQKTALATAQKQLGVLVKGAEEARQAARKLGDEHDKEKMLDAATERLKEKSREEMKKHLPRILAGIDAVAAANKKPDDDKALSAEAKTENTAMVGSGKAGFGAGGKGALAGKDKKGNSVTVEGKFGLKCWVEVTEVPLRKEVYEVSFHATFELEASLAGKLKQGSGFEVSAGKDLSISIKHELEGEARKNAYVDSVKAGKAGAWPELKLAAALDKAKVDDFKALVANVQALGGQIGGLQAMADGDEQEIESSDKSAYGAGAAGKFGIEAGVSKMGSVTRTVRRSGKKWEFEYVAVGQEGQSGGVSGQSAAGVGMGVKGSQAVQSFTRVVFEVQEDNPKLKERLAQVAAADSLEKLQALRAACSDLKFSFTTGRSQGGSKEIDWTAGPGGMSLAFGEGRGHTDTEDSDGNRVASDSGSNERGGTLKVLGDAVLGDKKNQEFHGAADQNNVGMGEVGDSTESFGLVDTLKDKAAKLVKEKLGVELGAKGADTEKHLKGLELSDGDYGKLAALAKKADDWDHAGLYGNDSKTYMLWKGLRSKVSGGKRAQINAALADFEAAAGNGLRDIVRSALGYEQGKAQAVEFEFPAALAGDKDFYIGFVRFDPMDDIRDAGDAKRMRKKWEATCEQIGTLVDKIHTNSKSFHDTGLAVTMAQRLQAVLKKVQAQGKALLAEAEKDQSTLPPSAEDEELALRAEHRAELEEKIRNLKRDIGSMHDVEENDFKAWEEVLDGFHLVKQTDAYLRYRGKMMKSQSDWKGLMLELKKVLEEAGPPYHPAEANAVRPDEDRLKRLVRRSGIQ